MNTTFEKITIIAVAVAICFARSAYAVKATDPYAIAKEWNEHGKWECAAKIDKLRIGMSQKEVVTVMACLPRYMIPINTDETASGLREQWVLHSGDPDDPTTTFGYLYFNNGTLVGISKRR
jgi:hypothetical protein